MGALVHRFGQLVQQGLDHRQIGLLLIHPVAQGEQPHAQRILVVLAAAQKAPHLQGVHQPQGGGLAHAHLGGDLGQRELVRVVEKVQNAQGVVHRLQQVLRLLAVFLHMHTFTFLGRTSL